MNLTHVVEDETVVWVSDLWGKKEFSSGGTYGFLKIPMDYAVSYRPGTRFGPDKILAALNSFSAYCADKNASFAHALFQDLGSIDVVHSLEETYRRIENRVRDLSPSITPIFIGGDHSISDPIIRGISSIHSGKRIGVIVFDAHFDSREPKVGKEHSGHWVYTLAGVMNYKLLTQIGINAPVYSKYYMEKAKTDGIHVYTPYELRKQGIQCCMKEIIDFYKRECDCVYISVDIDCIDQSFAPGTSVPNPCGLFPHEVCDSIYELSSNLNTIGFDINEVSPPLDQNDMTSSLAAFIVCNYIAGKESYSKSNA